MIYKDRDKMTIKIDSIDTLFFQQMANHFGRMKIVGQIVTFFPSPSSIYGALELSNFLSKSQNDLEKGK